MAKTLITGNKAIAQAAFDAGCDCYFSYPITPQTAIGEYLSEIMPKANRGYVCAESEIASINMVIGAAATGAKAMTSSSSCAISLMQEGLSYAVGDQLPLVLISVMRAGPGLGYIYPSQCDYNQAVTGGGNGDYQIPVLAPSTVQECIDLTHRAFYLAQKYRNPVILLSDGLLGQMMEPAEFVKYPYPEVDNSDWILTGAKGRPPRKIRSLEINEEKHNENLKNMFAKYAEMEEKEVMYEEHNVEDADV
ncbi:MAG: 3-methyl-2-oxobutanoate dehydrogenase subunit beta, partial [bacterium]|nr:3-methyl-2-oxobutanoate dehydrogenase subunit beta [bacterium]